MNLLKISTSNLKDKPLTSFLSILLMSLGIAIISLLLLAGKQIEEKFTPQRSRNRHGDWSKRKSFATDSFEYLPN